METAQSEPKNISPFCTCQNLGCPLHPTRHGRGCAPCIAKNLKLGEMPNCFFNAAGGAEGRAGDSFADFAAAVLRPKP